MSNRTAVSTIAALAAYLALAFFAAYWFLGIMGHDIGADLAIYRDAYLDASDGGDPYQPYDIGSSFVNHPFLLTIMGFASTTVVWLTISALTWLAVTIVVLRLPGCRPTTDTAAGPFVLTRPVLALLILAFAPALETFLTGQVNHVAMLCLVLALACDLVDRDWPAGLLLALAIVLKTSPAVFLGYYLVTGRWRVVAAAGVGLLLMSAAASIQFGSGILIEWMEVLPEIGATIHPSKFNQSILALSYRQLEPLGWSGLSDTLLAVHKFGFAAVVIVVLYRSWRCRRSPVSDRVWLLATLLTAIVVFSPLVWLHHSVFLVLAIALLIGTSSSPVRWLALAALVLIQFDRLFEFTFTFHAWPVLLAHGILLWVMLKGLPQPPDATTAPVEP